VQDILVHSSNIGAAKLALSIGEQKLYEYIRRFGFGERTGIELPGEIPGLVRPPQSCEQISITSHPDGHEVGVTPLQMTLAMAAIANGGKLAAAHREIDHQPRRAKRSAAFRPPFCARSFPGGRCPSRQRLARRGQRSREPPRPRRARLYHRGKTGTRKSSTPRAAMIRRKPLSRSRLPTGGSSAVVGLVVLDDPQTATREENYGGKVAGPIFARIAEKAARYLDLEPHEELSKAVSAGQVALTNPTRR